MAKVEWMANMQIKLTLIYWDCTHSSNWMKLYYLIFIQLVDRTNQYIEVQKIASTSRFQYNMCDL